MSLDTLRELPHPSLENYMMSRGLSPRMPMIGSAYLPYIKPEPFNPYITNNGSIDLNTKLAPTTPSYRPPMLNFNDYQNALNRTSKHHDDKPRDLESTHSNTTIPADKIKLENPSPVPSKDSFSTSSHSPYERTISWESGPPPTSMGHPYNPSGMFDVDMAKHTISGQSDLYFCHLCSYSGTSKFEFNEHMNSHFDHTCPYCDYTSRTEGRLKRHIKDFHTDDNLNTMQRTIPGRPKLFRCKQCDFVAADKVDYWTHARTHIKDEKLLQCPKCAFVTEYKHHLEYHLRNHFGSKPFKCEKCNYACVNKSMLNSHMKSHTNVYQYRCADCTYATKYCHSLKLHLRKYNHKPATILNPDGSLPQGVDAETSGVSLLAKRGPPRGPRGPRKDRFESYLNGLVSLPHTPMSRPGGGMPVNGGLMNPFWPYLGGQLPTPGFPPNPAMMFGMPPTPNGFPGLSSPFMKGYPNGISPSFLPGNSPRSAPGKCSICGFEASYKEDLASHMVKAHAAENHDLFKMFGISSDSLNDSENNIVERMKSKLGDDHAPLHIKTDYEPRLSQSCPLTWPSDNQRSTLKYTLIRSKSMPDLWNSDSADMSFYYDGDSTMTSPNDSPKCSDDSPSGKESQNSPKGSDILKQMTLRFGDGDTPQKDAQPPQVPLDLTKPKSYLFSDRNIPTVKSEYNQDTFSPSYQETIAYMNARYNPLPTSTSSYNMDSLMNAKYNLAGSTTKYHQDILSTNMNKYNTEPVTSTPNKYTPDYMMNGNHKLNPGYMNNINQDPYALLYRKNLIPLNLNASNNRSNEPDFHRDDKDHAATEEGSHQTTRQESYHHELSSSETDSSPPVITETHSPKRKHEDIDTQNEVQPASTKRSDAPSPSPRKRSRKGKAYKLDTLCWKLNDLQASSPYDEYKKMDDHSDREMESDEYGSEDVRKSRESTQKVECDTTDDWNPVNTNRDSTEDLTNHVNEESRTNDESQPNESKLRSNSISEVSKIDNVINQEICNNKTPASILENTQNKNFINSTKDANQPEALRRGAEIAWKILHPTDEGQTNLNSPPDGQTMLPLAMPPALIKADDVIPYSEKLNGLANRIILPGKDHYECAYCDIAFRDCVMYTMHMGYHGYRDPYQCNMCGHQSKNRVDFFLHIARAAHA